MRKRTSLIAAGALILQALGLSGPVHAADPVVETFAFTGGEQSWVVPEGVTTIHAVLIGGRGGGVGGGEAVGDRVDADLAVTAGTTLFVLVGGNGGNGGAGRSFGAGGFNGGGNGGIGGPTGSDLSGAGGGGASDVRTASVADAGSLESRLIVAAGGGGAGPSASGGSPREAGGDALPGATTGGQPGTQSAGGGGGVGIHPGADGSQGSGGAAGSSFQSDGGGGGGGGGWYGGGGGSADSDFGAGGGGGSSFVGATSNATVEHNLAAAAPAVTISYVPDDSGAADSGTVDAVVAMAASAVCLELSTASIDFGTRQFGDVGAPATPLIGITNCGAASETILARGTDATGLGPSAWSLVDSGSCVDATLGPDEFRLRLMDQATEDQVSLTTTNTTLHSLSGGGSASHEALIDTPCPGSSGAGVVMAMQIVFVATE